MASIDTHLRELSVGYYFFGGRELPRPHEFLVCCQDNIMGCEDLNLAGIAEKLISFSNKEKKILQDGFCLAQRIQEELGIAAEPQVEWTGSKSGSGSVVDLAIDDHRFSLKANSALLKNQGLATYLNTILGLNGDRRYQRGTHIFEDFAQPEFDEYFQITRDCLVANVSDPSRLELNGGRTVETKDGEDLILSRETDGKRPFQARIRQFHSCDYQRFEETTRGKNKEARKIFAEWIRLRAKGDPEYRDAQKRCSIAAGEGLLRFLHSEIDLGQPPPALYEFLQIEEREYYYAKVADGSCQFYRVPPTDEARRDLRLRLKEPPTFKVPETQLNLFTTLVDERTGGEIVLRNELRFSHGVFASCPEAKLYLQSGDLEALFKSVGEPKLSDRPQVLSR